MRKTEILNEIRKRRDASSPTFHQTYDNILQYLSEQFKAWRCDGCGRYLSESCGYIIWKINLGGYSKRMEVCAKCCKAIRVENEETMKVKPDNKFKQDLEKLHKPCRCGTEVEVQKITEGAYKDVWVAYCKKCDIEYYFEKDGSIHVVS